MGGAKDVMLLLDASNRGMVVMNGRWEHHVIEVLGISKRKVGSMARIREGRCAVGETAGILTIVHRLSVAGWSSGSKGGMVNRGVVVVS